MTYALHFLEKWNRTKKKYEFAGYFADYKTSLCYTESFFWTGNNTVIFTNYSEEYEHAKFYEMEIIEK